MMGTKSLRNTLFVAVAAVSMTGMVCPGGAPLPFGQITAVQVFEQPNFTVAFSVESAVFDPTALTQVNWVFGDGTGFVEGPADRATIQHRYLADGDYEVTAYLFDAQGFVDQITTIVNVAPNGTDPGPNPTPNDDPTKASNPNPTDGATNVDVDAELSWIAGEGATSHDVYFGMSEAAVESATPGSAGFFLGNQTETSFDPGVLDPDTQYFWRVDEVNDSGTTKGDVYSFRTGELPGAVTSPVPADGSVSARVDQILRWTAGDGATSHDVYFGKDAASVQDATTEDDAFMGNQSATNFDPEDMDADEAGLLLPNTTYYWRVDEVGVGGTTKGTLYQFKTSASPAKVMTPAPANGATDVNVSQVLSWTAAPGVESYDVYFGMDPVEVEAGDRQSVEFSGNQTTKTFDPNGVVGNTTYYWRIDPLGPGGTTKGDVFSFTTAAPPGQVTGPFLPAQDSANVDIETDLDWSAGVGGTTTTYTIYLSTNAAAVTNAQASALLQTQDASSTIVMRDSEDALNPDTTYFWRVDANGPGGSTTGPVLSFTTGSIPQAVTTPTPAIGANGVALNQMLSWQASAGATNYDVYLGTSQSDVQNAGPQDAVFEGTVNVTNYTPAELDGNTQYFWRVDAKGPGGVATGVVWQFTTAPERAENPMPTQNQMNVALDVDLTWTAGSGAVSHDVYLGTDLMAVTDADNADVEFQVNQLGTTFTPVATLMGNTTYFWRIDEKGMFGTTKGTVWQFTTGAGQADLVGPIDGGDLIALMPTLTWVAGDGASSHDVYLGTSESAVMNATRGSAEFKVTRLIGNEMYTPPARLMGSTTYFWRIDSVTANGTTKGEVWQFRTRPGRASEPMPENFATNVDAGVLLEWTADAEALRFEVYLGSNMTDVTNAEVGSVPIGVDLYDTMDQMVDPPGLVAGTTYFWRVDTVAGDDATRTRGPIWRFTVASAELPGQAGSPSPFSGATNTGLSPSLTWSAATNAMSYDVYFGTNMTDVQNASTGSPEFQGNQATRTFSPGMLAANTTYYWRIDAKNATGTTAGTVWSFTTMP